MYNYTEYSLSIIIAVLYKMCIVYYSLGSSIITFCGYQYSRHTDTYNTKFQMHTLQLINCFHIFFSTEAIPYHHLYIMHKEQNSCFSKSVFLQLVTRCVGKG